MAYINRKDRNKLELIHGLKDGEDYLRRVCNGHVTFVRIVTPKMYEVSGLLRFQNLHIKFEFYRT